jgi:hypothetical protein
MKVFGRPAWETWPLSWWVGVVVGAVVLFLGFGMFSPFAGLS